MHARSPIATSAGCLLGRARLPTNFISTSLDSIVSLQACGELQVGSHLKPQPRVVQVCAAFAGLRECSPGSHCLCVLVSVSLRGWLRGSMIDRRTR